MKFFSWEISKYRKEFHRKITFYCLLLIVLTLPWSLRANSISIILLALNWIAEGNFSEKFNIAKRDYLLKVFAIFYLLHIAGLICTDNFGNGRFELEKKLSLLVFPLVLSTTQRLYTNHVKKIFIAFFSGILTASLICIGHAFHRNNYLETFTKPNWLYFSYRDLTEIVNIQPTYLALYVSFSILILFFYLVGNAHFSQVKKIALILLTSYLVIFLFLMASRTAIAAVIIIFFSGIFYYFCKKKKLFKGIVTILSLSILLFAVCYNIPVMKERFLAIMGFEQKFEWISHYGDGKGVMPEARTMKWECAWNIIKENWLWGLGTGDVQDALQLQYKKTGFDLAYQQKFNPHNQFIETWLGLGVFGLSSLLSILSIPAILAFRRKNYFYLSFIMLIFFSCLTESILCRQLGVVFYAVFNSLFAFHQMKDFEQFSIKT